MKLYIASPVMGGYVPVAYMHSMARLSSSLQKEGISSIMDNEIGHSHIGRGRNIQLARFLRSDCTHLLTFDADQSIEPVTAIIDMMKMPYGIIGIPVATKWKQNSKAVVNAVLNRTCAPKDLHRVGRRYAITELDEYEIRDGVFEVSRVGTGCMLVKREVIEDMATEYCDRWFYSGMPDIPSTPIPWLYHDVLTEEHLFLSEDYGFCELWKKMGGKIYAFMGANIGHIGPYDYGGDFYHYMVHERGCKPVSPDAPKKEAPPTPETVDGVQVV